MDQRGSVFQYSKIVLVTVLVLAASPLILWLKRNPVLHLELFEKTVLNSYLNHQLSILPLAFLFIGITFVVADQVRLDFLNLTRRDGVIVPEPYLGIKPQPGESWKNLGVNFTIIISLVTAVVIFLQNIYGHTFNIGIVPDLVLVIIFAITNSFTEEVIYRLTFVSVVSNENLKPQLAKALSAAVFGGVHYFGNPSGIPGVLMAGFIGWFLAKSMNETRGFFWAWFIHFAQDVIILLALFAV